MSRPAPPVVIGVDGGGTRSHAMVAATDGTVLGRGQAPADDVARALAEAMAAADIVPVAVLHTVIAAETADRGGSTLGLPRCPTFLDRAVAVHAAGRPWDAGLVLTAGAGASAAAVHGTEVVARADGAGWLLGDEGSIGYLGLAAARAAVRALDGRGGDTVLLPAVLAGLRLRRSDDDMETVRHIISAVDSLPAAELAGLGPLVSEAAAGGDRVARDICEAAAAGLLSSLDAVRQRAPALAGDPPVIAGSVLLSPGPVGEIVSAGIFARYGRAPLKAGDVAGGAAWLALRHVHGEHTPVAAHALLTRLEDQRSPARRTTAARSRPPGRP